MPLLVSWIDNKIWSSRPVEGGSSSNANIPRTQKSTIVCLRGRTFRLFNMIKKSTICPQPSHPLRGWRRYQFFLHQSVRVPARKKRWQNFETWILELGDQPFGKETFPVPFQNKLQSEGKNGNGNYNCHSSSLHYLALTVVFEPFPQLWAQQNMKLFGWTILISQLQIAPSVGNVEVGNHLKGILDGR